MRDERAQMMLLTAVILLIGFVALAGMVARVSQLPDETLQERRRPVIEEARAVVRGVEQGWDRLDAQLAGDPVLVVPALEAMMAHMEFLQTARGFSFEYQVTCVPAGGDADVDVELTLRRPDTEVGVTVQRTYAGSPCP